MSRQDLSAIDRNTWSPLGRLVQEAMAHGITNPMIYEGLLTGQTAIQGLTVEQVTQNCVLGTRKVWADGSVFKYGRAGAIFCNIRQAISFYTNLANDGIDYVAPSQTQSIGDYTVTVVCALGCVANEFAGGKIIVHTHAAANHQFRTIVSNTVAAAGNTTVITVSEPWTIALALAHGCEIFVNPWSDLRLTDGVAHVSKAGIPYISVTVALNYFWTQTWGICWGNPYGTTGAASVDGERRLTFDTAGNICPASDNRYAGDHADMQHAGYTIERTGAGVGYGTFMLQCSR